MNSSSFFFGIPVSIARCDNFSLPRSVDLDLSKELVAPPKSVLEEQVKAARRGRAVATEVSQSPSMLHGSPFISVFYVSPTLSL